MNGDQPIKLTIHSLNNSELNNLNKNNDEISENKIKANPTTLSSKLNQLFKLNSPFKEKKLICDKIDLNEKCKDKFNQEYSFSNNDQKTNHKKGDNPELLETEFVLNNNKKNSENIDKVKTATSNLSADNKKILSKKKTSNRLDFNNCYDDESNNENYHDSTSNNRSFLSQSLKPSFNNTMNNKINSNNNINKPSDSSCNFSYDMIN